MRNGYNPDKTVNCIVRDYLARQVDSQRAAELIAGAIGLERIAETHNSYVVHGSLADVTIRLSDDPVTHSMMVCLGNRLVEQTQQGGQA